MERTKSMGLIVLLVLALAILPSQLQSYDHSMYNSYPWLYIDCGGSSTWEDPLTTQWWMLDDNFTKTGQNVLLSVTTSSLPLETLRYFPQGTKNCYILPLEFPDKYLIRAGFLYANYDNLFNPPTFNLLIDGNFWATVTTSLFTSDPIYYELIYFTTKRNTVICLNQTDEAHIPFISSLEAIPVPAIYRFMDNNTAYYLEHRTNYGANQTVPERFDMYEDYYNRFWKPVQLPNYQNLFTGTDSLIYAIVENDPPYQVLNYAVQGQNTSDSIVLPVDFHDTTTQISAYFVFYFYHVGGPRPILNNVTKQIVYIDGVEKNATTIIPYKDCVVVSVYPVKVTGGRANVTIAPAQGTTLPPVLNAMEVFTTVEVSTSVSLLLHYSYSMYSWFLFLGYFLL